jgi:uncharacterized membrane protein
LAQTRSGAGPSTRLASSGRRSTSSGRHSSSSCGSRSTRSRIGAHWDPYPFILLNLAFSTQAAYAAPLILLAQTRQAERDKQSEGRGEKARQHAEKMASERVAAIKAETDRLVALLNSNTELTKQDKELTEQVAALTREIHAQVTSAKA